MHEVLLACFLLQCGSREDFQHMEKQQIVTARQTVISRVQVEVQNAAGVTVITVSLRR